LGERYRLLRPLGRGGMGSVWRAEHLTLNSAVALKLIETPDETDPTSLQRFLREARLAAALRSPHVVQMFDYGVDQQTPYIAMELLEGESLAERLERVGRLSAAETARVIVHVARAMTRAHEAGIVHRDLKPDNVFIVRNDDEEVMKVFDFGIAKAHPAGLGSSAVTATRTGVLLGTPSYMSPEQAQGARDIDFRTDIWALGVMAYRCLLGRLPFTAGSIGQLILAICSQPLPVPSQHGCVPNGFDSWFARACARLPRDRFASAKEAALALTLLQGDGPAREAVPLSQLGEPLSSPTTGPFSNSEVASVAAASAAPPRLLTPRRLVFAGLSGVAVLLALRIPGVYRRMGSVEPVRRQTEQVVAPLEARPTAPLPGSLAAEPVSASVRPSDMPSGVRLAAGVRVVPSLPRSEVSKPAPAPVPSRQKPAIITPVTDANPSGPRPGRGASTRVANEVPARAADPQNVAPEPPTFDADLLPTSSVTAKPLRGRKSFSPAKKRR
jgi:serine/threonine protein kinase